MSLNTSDTSPPGAAWDGYDMEAIFSPFYWGTVISLVLSGITFLQAYTYFPSKDRRSVQTVAAVMIVLDIASTALCAKGMYIYFVPHFGSMLPLQTLTPTIASECYLAVIITFLSQLYFAWQIWTVSKDRSMFKYVMSGLVVLFGIVAFGKHLPYITEKAELIGMAVGGISCATFMIIDKMYILMNRSDRFTIAVGIAKGAAAVSDAIATVALCYSLGSARTGFDRTDSIIKTLMGYVVERGILVTLIQTLFLVLFFVKPGHLFWLSLHVNVTRLYANTFFAMLWRLNGRERLKRIGNQSQSTYVMSMGIDKAVKQTGGEGGMSFNTVSSPETSLGSVQIEKSTVVASF
ncbi:uncharacterized protein EV420DRAFT_1634189 [Desarmillaria tabescens]|uniref:DUF6534 domain-containing protein n=1 Tax=Armillaria tabescens TaxID=1929756 RepID=A0AA39TY62_ARMTA|nr:uncharacterized protein EV420DRAFT_1634189 [Desarmillaria tabescens]KAK0469768.1 hypothetical protein EV420DRAFT_1634189 [Desarmillaria tabescens]